MFVQLSRANHDNPFAVSAKPLSPFIKGNWLRIRRYRVIVRRLLSAPRQGQRKAFLSDLGSKYGVRYSGIKYEGWN
jgi:hypothetical protein